MKAKKAPTCQINDKVSAELYLDGLNLVLSPSVHKSGHTYIWEITGDIPDVKWADLCRWFGFSAPEAKKRGRPSKEKPWWSRWNEDLRTLDLAGVMEDLGRLGACLDPDTNKWSVRCPWESEHSAAVPPTRRDPTRSFSTSRKPCRDSSACTRIANHAGSRTWSSGRKNRNPASSPPVAPTSASGNPATQCQGTPADHSAGAWTRPR